MKSFWKLSCTPSVPVFQIVGKMLLRRTKNMVTDLPAKHIYVCKIKMSPFQQKIYHILYPRTEDIKTTKGYNSARQMATSLKTCLRWEMNKLRRIPEAIRIEIGEKTDEECSGNFAKLLHIFPDS